MHCALYSLSILVAATAVGKQVSRPAFSGSQILTPALVPSLHAPYCIPSVHTTSTPYLHLTAEGVVVVKPRKVSPCKGDGHHVPCHRRPVHGSIVRDKYECGSEIISLPAVRHQNKTR